MLTADVVALLPMLADGGGEFNRYVRCLDTEDVDNAEFLNLILSSHDTITALFDERGLVKNCGYTVWFLTIV